MWPAPLMVTHERRWNFFVPSANLLCFVFSDVCPLAVFFFERKVKGSREHFTAEEVACHVDITCVKHDSAVGNGVHRVLDVLRDILDSCLIVKILSAENPVDA